tara:strand:+ start:8432 stop:12811 length:4380 start_codon:yes stop_codon:yes gene_type:complete
MAKYIDIKDFDGTLTNADIEDLPENVAQEIKNLKIQAGKLEKTFGAGTPSGVPAIGLSFVDTNTGTTNTVYNIFTFISDKLDGATVNDAGDQYRYLLVTIDNNRNTKLWWYDFGAPDVTDHLQIENNIVWFKTASAHGFVEDDYVLVQDCKHNTDPLTDITSAGVYEQVDHVPTDTTLGVNTDSATSWGGSFFDISVASGFTAMPFGGKVATHKIVDDTVAYGGTDWGEVEDIAIVSMLSTGTVLCMAKKTNELVYMTGTGSFVDLATSLYTTYKAKTNFAVCGMLSFHAKNAIYVHYSYQDGSPASNYNKIVKYACDSSGNITESAVGDLGTTAVVSESFFQETTSSGSKNLFILAKGLGLYGINTSDSIASHSLTITGTLTTINTSLAKGMTSIIQTNKLTSAGGSSVSDVAHEYLVILTDEAPSLKFYSRDITSGSVTTYGLLTDLTTTGTPIMLSKMDFGENSNRSESLVVYYTASSVNYLKYSLHNDTTIARTLDNIATSGDLQSDANLSVTFIKPTNDLPTGATKYLMVGTDNPSASQSGKLLGVTTAKQVKEFANPGTTPGKTNWNPSCFDGCSTGVGFFTHAKAYIGVYGTEAQDGSSADHADVYRFTDIGWLQNTWSGTGDCEYRWFDLTDKYDIPATYNNTERNPIIPFGDTVRVLAGNIAEYSSNEAKGIWLGYIDRKYMNDGVTITPGFYGYSNVLTNPFSISDDIDFSETKDELRDSDESKYVLTALYDGVQETLIDDSSAVIINDVVGISGATVFDVSKSKVVLPVNIDFSTLNKRVTGLNLYRSNRYNGVWETYKKIQEVNFIKTQNAGETSDKYFFLQATTDNVAYVKDDGGYIASIDDSNETTYALKVGSNWKRRIVSISSITQRNVTGAELNADITSSSTTGVSVTNASSLSATDYFLGAEKVAVSSIDTSANTVTLTRAQGSPATTAVAHVRYTEFRSTSATATGWFIITVDDAFRGKRFNDSWQIYKDRGVTWDQTKSASSGAYGGKYVGIGDLLQAVISSGTDSEYTNNLDIDAWRNSTTGNVDVTTVSGKWFETIDRGQFKINDISTWEDHLGMFFIKLNRPLPAGTWNDQGKIGGALNIVNTSTNNYTATITDDGLTSLGEHWGEAVESIRVNAKYGKIVKSRLFLGNVVLDIGDENEERSDWVVYSEVNQFDVRPVSNAIQFPDREGGQITGLSELFGRLIVFKAQAIFVLDLANPMTPSTWTRKETKINIGNIAPEGIVEVHDSVYFVHHDGIYKLDANTTASSDATPSLMEKITLGIEDQFLLADSKRSVKGVYDQKNNEILYTWDVSNAQVVWAYNIVIKTWRKVDTTANMDILAFAENSGPLTWDETDKNLKKFDVAEAVGTAWKSKRFPLDLDRKRLIRYGMVKFTGTDTLTVNVYLDGAGSASFTKTITADGGINRFPIKRYGKNFEIELTTPSSANAFSVERVRIETE